MENIEAHKSLGQNFLKDETVLKKIAHSFPVTKDDVILEIGPGLGALTKYLVLFPSYLLCYEIDNRFQVFLQKFESSRCHIYFKDFLKQDFVADLPEKYNCLYVVANIPYYITTSIIEHILKQNVVVDGMTLLVQKEVAKRFAAFPKNKDYGYFSVFLRHFFDIEILFDVPPLAFDPSPNVMSSVVQMKRKENIVSLDLEAFQAFLKQCFSMKRKTLKNNLKSYPVSLLESFLQNHGYRLSIRAEELSYEDFVELFFLFQND